MSPAHSEVGGKISTHSPVSEASSTTGDDLENSNEELDLITDMPYIRFPQENIESPVMEIAQYRNENLRIRYSLDMVPASYEDCSRTLLEVLCHHHDIMVTYGRLFGNLVSNQNARAQSPEYFAEINL